VQRVGQEGDFSEAGRVERKGTACFHGRHMSAFSEAFSRYGSRFSSASREQGAGGERTRHCRSIEVAENRLPKLSTVQRSRGREAGSREGGGILYTCVPPPCATQPAEITLYRGIAV